MSLLDLLRFPWKSSDGTERRDRAEQAMLSDIVDTSADQEARMTALKKITDQRTLARVASGHDPLSRCAAEQLSDQKLLAEVARMAVSAEVRGVAVAKVEDVSVLQ